MIQIWVSKISKILVQMMAFCLFGTKPLSRPVIACYWLDPCEQFIEISIKMQQFAYKKWIWKWCLQSRDHFSLNVLRNHYYDFLLDSVFVLGNLFSVMQFILSETLEVSVHYLHNLSEFSLGNGARIYKILIQLPWQILATYERE